MYCTYLPTILPASQIFKRRIWLQRWPFFRQSFIFASSLLLFHFFFSIDKAPHYDQLSVYRMTLNDKRRVTLSFPPSCSIIVFSWLTFTFLHRCSFFLGRFNRMATVTGFLASGHDGHALGIGIGNKGLRKTWETSRRSWGWCTHFSFVNSKVIALLALFLGSLSLDTTTNSLGTGPPLLHSVPH
jgi:hypothetical protein